MPASIPFKPKFSLCLTPARASSSTTPPHDRRGIRIKISPHPLRSLRLKSKISNFSVRLGLAVARLARVPMGCEHPQGAVTRLKTSTKNILSTTSTKPYNSHINNHDLVKYYQISALAVNSEIAATLKYSFRAKRRMHLQRR